MTSVSQSQWSVVGKNTKKKGSTQPMSKNQKKAFIENMPRIETNAPLEESSTIYDAFLEKEARALRASQAAKEEESKHNGLYDVPKKATTGKKKKAETSERKKLPSFEESVAKIERSDLEAVVVQSQTSFPDNEEVWLKDMASFLNLKIACAPATDPVFTNKPKDYPMRELSAGCRDLILGAMKRCGEETLDHLHYHCVQELLKEMSRGVSTYGYTIFIQILAQFKPDVALSKTLQYMELLKLHQNRHARLLSILWVLGQCGVPNLASGIRVWLDFMVPMMGIRPVASFPVEYLEALLKLHKDERSAHGVMTIRDFFPILDMVFGSNINIQSDLRKRLNLLYPKLKLIAYGDTPKTTLRSFFPSFLIRANVQTSNSMRNEVLDSLVHCLVTDVHCYSVWRHMYTKHLTQSSVLLQHIYENWGQLSGKLDRKMLLETLSAFSVTNDEMGSGAEEAGCAQSCKDLLLKLNESRFSWFWFFFLINLLVGSIIAYDIYSSKSFRASRTSRFLEEYGILAVLEYGWLQVTTYCNIAISWLKVNTPHYYSVMVSSIGPYTRMTADSIIQGYQYVVTATHPHREWLYLQWVTALQWMFDLSPSLWSSVWHHLWVSWGVVQRSLLWLWQYVIHLCIVSCTWLHEHILSGSLSPENILISASAILTSLQGYISVFIQWCGNIITSTTPTMTP